MDLTPQAQAEIASLAELYDRFAFSTDNTRERRLAEQTFNDEVASWHDSILPPKPSLRDFNRAVIGRCKFHLKAQIKAHPAIPPTA